MVRGAAVGWDVAHLLVGGCPLIAAVVVTVVAGALTEGTLATMAAHPMRPVHWGWSSKAAGCFMPVGFIARSIKLGRGLAARALASLAAHPLLLATWGWSSKFVGGCLVAVVITILCAIAAAHPFSDLSGSGAWSHSTPSRNAEGWSSSCVGHPFRDVARGGS